jgi:hypothetical protein
MEVVRLSLSKPMYIGNFFTIAFDKLRLTGR